LRGAGEAEPFFSCAGDLFQGKANKGEVRGRGWLNLVTPGAM
jgi:hypothetical protein